MLSSRDSTNPLRAAAKKEMLQPHKDQKYKTYSLQRAVPAATRSPLASRSSLRANMSWARAKSRRTAELAMSSAVLVKRSLTPPRRLSTSWRQACCRSQRQACYRLPQQVCCCWRRGPLFQPWTEVVWWLRRAGTHGAGVQQGCSTAVGCGCAVQEHTVQIRVERLKAAEKEGELEFQTGLLIPCREAKNGEHHTPNQRGCH